MPSFSRRITTIIIFIAIVAVGWGIFEFWQSQNNAPEAFLSAQSQGAAIAANIVSTSQQSTQTLEQVNQDDLKGDDKDALALVSGMVTNSEDLRNQAVSLSNQIEAMTQSLSGIHSQIAQQAALEAISSHLAMINQLINYSGDLGNLLDALQQRFSSGGVSNTQIQTLVNQVNTDVTAINNFNNQAAQAMQQFNDSINK